MPLGKCTFLHSLLKIVNAELEYSATGTNHKTKFKLSVVRKTIRKQHRLDTDTPFAEQLPNAIPKGVLIHSQESC